MISMGTAIVGNAAEHQLDEILPSLVIVGMAVPPTAALSRKVELPEHRKKELITKSNEYQTIYYSRYKSAMKIQRFKYSLLALHHVDLL